MGRLLRAYERHLWGPLCRRYTTNHHRPEEANMPSVRTVDELEAILVARNAENAALRVEVRTLKAEQRRALDYDLAPLVPSPDREVIAEVALERCNQDREWGEQNHPDGTGPGMYLAGIPVADYAAQVKAELEAAAKEGRATWAMILLEEVAEAFAEGTPHRLRAELLQVAAVAIAWAQAIDRRRARARESALARRHARVFVGPAGAHPASDDFVEVTGAALYVDEEGDA